MNDYSKWDNIVDSDEEREQMEEKIKGLRKEEQELILADQDEVANWLKRQEAGLARAQREPPPPPPPPTRDGAMHFPEAPSLPPARYRRVTDEERKVLAMVILISNFEEGQTNLDRHPQMLELVRHNRWLEEDPATLELLCQAHNQSMKLTGSGGARQHEGNKRESEDDARIRAMCLCGINTLAAAKVCGFPGGLLEVVQNICTPETEKQKELRKKWQKKEFGKDAIFESLFPDCKRNAEGDDDQGWTEIWIFVALIVLLAAALVFLMWGPTALSGKSKNATETASAVLSAVQAVANATTASPIPAAAASALGGGSGAGDQQRTIEELQRQIEELKRAQASAAEAGSAANPGRSQSEL